VAGTVADLQQALAGRSAAAGQPVAAVAVAGELDPEAAEPLDGARRLPGQDLDQPRVRGVVRALDDVRGVDRDVVVLAERRLDPALGLRGVRGRQPELGRQQHARARVRGSEGGLQAGAAGADHQHVTGAHLGHPTGQASERQPGAAVVAGPRMRFRAANTARIETAETQPILVRAWRWEAYAIP
jgi:hypothetical protein